MKCFCEEYPELAAAHVLFGLRAQGHIPTVERMLTEGKGWDAIGQAIGWCPLTAQKHYEHIRAMDAQSNG